MAEASSGRPDPTERFSDRVDDYVRYRPGYPAGVVDVLREEVGLRGEWVVADIGSGTGLSADLFLAHGNAVVGVEPNAAMRRAAELRHGGEERFRSVAGSAEATGLAPGSVDLVVAAQAFHWFDVSRARSHLHAILREPRPAALLWNTRRTTGAPLLEAYEALLLEFGTDYDSVRHDALPTDAIASFFGGPYVRRVLPNAQVLDGDGLRGRLLSSSYVPGPDDPRRGPMLERLEAIFRSHERDGRVRLEYDTEVLVGHMAADPP